MLEILTFTGLDDRTDRGRLSELSSRFPKVEWGILVGSYTALKADRGIWPSLNTIDELQDLGVPTSLHLCGAWARGALNGTQLATAQCGGSARVQINLHGDERSDERIGVFPEAVEEFLVPYKGNVILQHQEGWDTVPVRHERVEYLFDRSEGSGQEHFAEWPAPSEHLSRMGYAGGIGAHNIGQAMYFVGAFPSARLWLDMESHIRTGGYLDLDLVEAVCVRASELSSDEGMWNELLDLIRDWLASGRSAEEGVSLLRAKVVPEDEQPMFKLALESVFHHMRNELT